MSEPSSLDEFDHRVLGKKLGLFAHDAAIGQGLPLWLPKGTVIRDELETLAKELEFKAGFDRVATPHLARTELYRASGHLPYFADDMYPAMTMSAQRAERASGKPGGSSGEAAGNPGDAPLGDKGGGSDDDDSYVLRPMNCPHHHRVFAAAPRSYRDLPLRLAEYGQVYRWERSGALSGLARVRGMCMNDGHIYCTRDQVERELESVLDMYEHVYGLLGIERFRFRLSRRDAADPRGKYVDDAASWQWAEALLARVLERRGIAFEDGTGHAAFYGPKIDVQVATLSGHEETLSTVQVDFAQPARLGLEYTAASGKPETPLCIHRAPLSTHERFVAFLVEHFRGAFPTWLAPVQLAVIAVSERYRPYAESLVERLRARMIRAELLPPDESVTRNVRSAAEQKVPNIAVVGEREARDGSVTLRRRGSAAQVVLSVDALEAELLEAIARRYSIFGS
jgi:threonyl-tRNA synthetase